MIDPEFDDIRPYSAEEIPAAMQRIAADPLFPTISSFVFPDKEVEEVRAMVRDFTSVEAFQKKVMYELNERIIKTKTAGFTVSGTENISRQRPCLFVSNHRDIVLDASLLQNVLVDLGLETSEITFGANLMSNQLVVDIGKSNRMFKVVRGGSPREFYQASAHLSEYMRRVLTEDGRSVWIAQRNGRTKDGNDLTDQGVVKMFGISRSDDKIESLVELNITPVAVSYEWEPCDILKVLEKYESSRHAYVKKPGEDLNSVLTGMLADKGRVHFHICQPLSRSDLMAYSGLTSSAYNREVASLIDRRVWAGYKLFPNNYIAHDIRYGSHEFRDRYTLEQREAFVGRMSSLLKYEDYDLDSLREIFLAIYSNPVDNYLKINK